MNKTCTLFTSQIRFHWNATSIKYVFYCLLSYYAVGLNAIMYLRFLTVLNKIVNISGIWALSSCTSNIIWSQILHSSDQAIKPASRFNVCACFYGVKQIQSVYLTFAWGSQKVSNSMTIWDLHMYKGTKWVFGGTTAPLLTDPPIWLTSQ